MLRCLSVEQIEDLIWGRTDPVMQEAAEAHLDQCDECRRRFLDLTVFPQAEAWRLAALEVSATPPNLQERLNQFKDFPDRSFSTSLASEPQPEEGKNHPLAESDAESVHEELVVPLPGSRLGQRPVIPGFEILGELGRGGMGVVYKARQLSHDRMVALKMIHSGRESCPEDLGRFHDEAEAISRLRHPHIVQIYEVGEVEGRFYFVLEYVEGGTLSDQIHGHPIPPRPSAQLLEALARAMHYAHQRGIVHRDLKPGNVLLHGRKVFSSFQEDIDRQSEEWDFRRFMPKITDFGLAKLLDRQDHSGHTSSGDVVGTPSYMAPEQAQGQTHLIGPATDVYALGAILYEMLTGRPPFQGATPMDTLFQVHSAEPIPPRQLVRDVPVDLETICLKCLRKDPTNRYPTAEALADDLRRFLEGSPIRTQGLRTLSGERHRLWIRRGVLLVSAVTLGGIAGVTAFEFRKHLAPVLTTHVARSDDAGFGPRDNEFRLRLRLAQADCERGDIIHGVGQMIRLLSEVEQRTDGTAWQECLNANIQAWSRRLPKLVYESPASGRDLDMDGASSDLFVVTNRRELFRIRPDGSSESIQLPEVDEARMLSVSQSGSDLVAISSSGLRWWDQRRGELLVRMPHLRDVTSLCLAPDGSTALIRAEREGNSLWLLRRNIASKSLRAEPLRVDRSASCWAWHPSSDRILVGHSDGRIEVIFSDRPDGRQEVKRLTVAVTGLAWPPPADWAVVAGNDGMIRFVSSGGGSTTEEFPPIRAHPPGRVILAAGGKDTIVSAGVDRVVRIWSASRGVCLFSMPLESPVQKIFLSADGRRLAILDAGRTRLWTLPESVDRSIPFGVEARRVEVQPGGTSFALLVDAPRPSVVIGRRHDTGIDWSSLPLESHEEVAAFHFQPQSSRLGVLVRRADRCRLEQWDETGGKGGDLLLGDGVFEDFAFSPDGKTAFAVAGGEVIVRCDLEANIARSIQVPHLKDVRLLRVAPDGMHLLLSSAQGAEIWLWSDVPRRLWASPSPLIDGRWSADSRELLMWDARYAVNRWSEADGLVAMDEEAPKTSDLSDLLWTRIRPGPNSTLLRIHRGQIETLAHWPAAELRSIRWPTKGHLILTAWQDGVRLIDGSTAAMLGPVLELSDVIDASWTNSFKEIAGWTKREMRIWKWSPPTQMTSSEWRSNLERRMGSSWLADPSSRLVSDRTDAGEPSTPKTMAPPTQSRTASPEKR